MNTMGTLFRGGMTWLYLLGGVALSTLIGLAFIAQVAFATTPNQALAFAFVGMSFVIGPMLVFFVYALLVNHRRRDFQGLFGIPAPQEREELALLWPHVDRVLQHMTQAKAVASTRVATGDLLPPHEHTQRVGEYRSRSSSLEEALRLARAVGFAQQLDENSAANFSRAPHAA